jgi:hypothetical protein
MDESAAPMEVSASVESAPQEVNTDVSTSEGTLESPETTDSESTDDQPVEGAEEATDSTDSPPEEVTNRVQERIKTLTDARKAAEANAKIAQENLVQQESYIAQLEKQIQEINKTPTPTVQEDGTIPMEELQQLIKAEAQKEALAQRLNAEKEAAAMNFLSVEQSKVFAKDQDLLVSDAHQKLFSAILATQGTATLPSGKVIPTGDWSKAHEEYKSLLNAVLETQKDNQLMSKAREAASASVKAEGAIQKPGTATEAEHIFTLREIETMSSKQYEKLQSKIQSQLERGLIK